MLALGCGIVWLHAQSAANARAILFLRRWLGAEREQILSIRHRRQLRAMQRPSIEPLGGLGDRPHWAK
jgi:hypothetical protein